MFPISLALPSSARAFHEKGSIHRINILSHLPSSNLKFFVMAVGEREEGKRKWHSIEKRTKKKKITGCVHIPKETVESLLREVEDKAERP